MKFAARRFAKWLFPAGGLLSLALHGGMIPPVAMIAVVLAAGIAGWRCLRGRDIRWVRCASLGWLAWLARLTYWDAAEFSMRMGMLAGLISLALIVDLLSGHGAMPRLGAVFQRMSLGKRMLVLFLGAWLALAAGAAGLTLGGIPMLGDEPHYLVIAQSILQDGDCNVANQYAQRQYQRFIPGARMGIHGFFGWKDERFQARRYRDDLPPPRGAFIYSIHLPGMAVIMVPVVAVPMQPGWWIFLLRVWLGLFGAGIVVMTYLLALRLARRRDFAFRAALVALCTPPLFFHSIHAYPDAQVLLMLMAALYLLLYGRNRSRAVPAAGLLLGLLFFWGVKYAIFVWSFTLLFSVFFYRQRRFRDLWRLWLFPLVFQALFLGYLYNAYGNISPTSVYMNYTQKKQFSQVVFKGIPNQVRVDSLLDYFLDQRDGLLPYAPVFFLAFPGLLLAIRRWRRYLGHLLLAVPAGIFVFSYAFLSHRGGQCPQARPLIPVIWALLLFIWIYLRESRNQWMQRAWRWLPLYGAGVTIFQVFYPWTLYQPTTHNVPIRAGLMFQIWSPLGVRLNEMLPSFAKVPGNWSWWPNPIWLVILLVLGWLALRKQGVKRMRSRVVTGIVGAGVLVLTILLPRVPDHNPTLVSGEGMLPHRIMGAARYPRRVERRRFSLEAGRGYSFTLTTNRPAGAIDVEWSGEGSPPFRLKLFDAQVHSAGPDGWRLEHPRFRRHRSRYVYRLHLAPVSATGADGILEILPRRR